MKDLQLTCRCIFILHLKSYQIYTFGTLLFYMPTHFPFPFLILSCPCVILKMEFAFYFPWGHLNLGQKKWNQNIYELEKYFVTFSIWHKVNRCSAGLSFQEVNFKEFVWTFRICVIWSKSQGCIQQPGLSS